MVLKMDCKCRERIEITEGPIQNVCEKYGLRLSEKFWPFFAGPFQGLVVPPFLDFSLMP